MTEAELEEVFSFLMERVAESLRDQAALAAERGEDDLAALLRELAERVPP